MPSGDGERDVISIHALRKESDRPVAGSVPMSLRKCHRPLESWNTLPDPPVLLFFVLPAMTVLPCQGVHSKSHSKWA